MKSRSRKRPPPRPITAPSSRIVKFDSLHLRLSTEYTFLKAPVTGATLALNRRILGFDFLNLLVIASHKLNITLCSLLGDAGDIGAQPGEESQHVIDRQDYIADDGDLHQLRDGQKMQYVPVFHRQLCIQPIKAPPGIMIKKKLSDIKTFTLHIIHLPILSKIILIYLVCSFRVFIPIYKNNYGNIVKIP